MDIQKVQRLLNKYKLNYWLLTDYHGRDSLSKELVGLPADFFSSRRWIYLIPSSGEPLKIVSHIERHILDGLDGETLCYTSYESLKEVLSVYLSKGQVAMQYSPNGVLPVISTTDAGFVELVQSLGAEVVSSGDLIQEMKCILSEEDILSHRRAGEKIIKIRDEVYETIRKGIDHGEYLSEWDVLQLIKKKYEDYDLTCDHDEPYVAVNDHATQMTFSPTPENSYLIREDACIVLDLWAREKTEGSIYYDVTFCAYTGENIPPIYRQQFEKVVGAREHCLEYIQKCLNEGKEILGYEVDRTCRTYLDQYGEAQYLLHRTGHNIGKQVHGPGANLDSFEAIDYRRILPGTLFSIEPGLYKENIGVRTEMDVYIDQSKKVHIFGERQYNIYSI